MVSFSGNLYRRLLRCQMKVLKLRCFTMSNESVILAMSNESLRLFTMSNESVTFYKVK